MLDYFDAPVARLEYFIRVKLPKLPAWDEPGDYHEMVKDAIFAVKPRGFEVIWERSHLWPTDNDGNTLVLLHRTGGESDLLHWIEETYRVQKKLDMIRKAVGP